MPLEKTRSEHGGRDAKGRWTAGTSGNIRGKPRGARHRATRLVEQLIDDQAEALVNKVIALALDGDVQALGLVLSRLCPPRKDRPVSVDLPPVASAADLPGITAALLRAVAGGELTPDEGSEIAKLIAAHKGALELGELEARVRALEEKAG